MHTRQLFSGQLAGAAFSFSVFERAAARYLELLHAGHVVAEYAVLQQGDGVTLTTDLLDLLTRAVAERGERWVRGCCGDYLTIWVLQVHYSGKEGT